MPATGMPVGQSLDYCNGMPVAGLTMCAGAVTRCHAVAGIKVGSLLSLLLCIIF